MLSLKELQKSNPIGDIVTVVALVKKAERKTAKNDNPYVSGVLGNAKIDINFLCWTETYIDALVKSTGELLELTVQVDSFKGRMQLKVQAMAPLAKDALTQEQRKEFLVEPDHSRKEWMAFYNKEIKPLIEDNAVESVIDVLLSNDAFWVAPAAKAMHHDFVGGLQDHVIRLLKLYKGLVGCGHPSVDNLRHGLVIFGLIGHDYMKTKEYTVEDGKIEYSRYGHLVGHLAGGAINLQSIILENDIRMSEELYLHMTHVLLAHHSSLEWGSPVTPHTPEAWTVHSLDNLDAKLWMFDFTEDMGYRRGLGAVCHFKEEE